MKAFNVLRVVMYTCALLAPSRVIAQEGKAKQLQEMHTGTSAVTPLAALVEEAGAKNPQILAAGHAYKAAANTPKSAGALPDTHLMVQQFAVGSPRPFAGYTNSDFAYIGIGASQDLPYPGKRKLRSEAAAREADSLQARAESSKRDVIQQVKAVYFRLAYVEQAIQVLQHHDQIMGEMQEIAESRYRVGHGYQQEVLKTQLQRTKLLQEIAIGRRDEGQLEAQLKQLLDRPQDSADIITEPLTERAIVYAPSQLLQLAKEQNPAVPRRKAMLRRAESRVAWANRNSDRISACSTCIRTPTASFATITC